MRHRSAEAHVGEERQLSVVVVDDDVARRQVNVQSHRVQSRWRFDLHDLR